MIVLVHGVPETAEIWDDVRERLDQPSVALRMPGFGCPRPNGFTATKDAYVDWLLDELKQIDGPVDLIGHDWGGGLSLRVGTKYPEAVRSWATDVANLMSPDYVWHDFAQLWQTPEVGEQFWKDNLATPPEDGAATFQLFGLEEKAALKLARMADETMAGCILDLYRSAMPNTYADWSDGYKTAEAPGLVLLVTDDPFTGASGADVATVLGAQTTTIESNHFWPLQVPEQGAKVINDFVASLG